jgi:hypothetical protein
MLFAIGTGSNVADDENKTRRALIIKDETKLCRILHLYSDFEWTAVQKSGQANGPMIPPSQELARVTREFPELSTTILIMEAKDTKETFAIQLNRWQYDTRLYSTAFLRRLYERIGEQEIPTSRFMKPMLLGSVEQIFWHMQQVSPIAPYLELQNRHLFATISEERILNEIVFIVKIREASLGWVESRAVFMFTVIASCTLIASFAVITATTYPPSTAYDHVDVIPNGASSVTRSSSTEIQHGQELLLQSLQSTWLILTAGRLGFYFLPILSCFLPSLTPLLRQYRLLLSLMIGLSMYMLDLITWKITLKLGESYIILCFVLTAVHSITDISRWGGEIEVKATHLHLLMCGIITFLYITRLIQ